MRVYAGRRSELERAVRGESVAFRGPARNPMSWEEEPVKVRNCFRRALSEGDTERVMDMLANLKNDGDVGELMGVLGQAAENRK